MATLPAEASSSTSMEEESRRERNRAILLRQISDALKVEGSAKFNKDFFRRVFHSKDLGQKLFELFDEKQEGQLAQDEWLESLKERLTDEKQADFAEQLESVAYVLCGDEPITPERFRAILQAKGVLDKLFRLVDKEAAGVVTPGQIMDFLAQVSASRPKAGFDQGSLEWLETLFRQTVGDKKEISLDDFNKIVHSKNPFFRERVFQIFDKDDSGSISRQEFFDAMQKFAGQSPEDKIRFLFKVYDIDGDGLVQRRELEDVMRACMEENGMCFSEEQLQQLTGAMFDDADIVGRGAITYDALKAQLERHGGLLENLSISIDRWLVPPKPSPPPKKRKMLPYQFSMPYMRNNLVYLAFLGVYAAINTGLFLARLIHFYPMGYLMMFARASGQCLNFNCMFVLVLMLRHCITFLRTRGFAAILPLDQNIYLHKLVGMVIFAMGVLHSIMHILNVVLSPNLGNFSAVEWIFTAKPGILGLIPGWANPTGVVLIIVLSIMVICSQPFVRRGGSFEIFYWTHLLYCPFFFLVIVHAPNFWKWFLAPGLIFLAEQVVRFSWLRTERGKTYISSGLLLPSKVVHLVIKRPLHFDFHVGDYVFVNVPAIAKYEWHPFTISSAPEQEGYLWLHVRGVGEWTNRLYAYFEKEQERLHATEAPASAAILPGLITENAGNRTGGVTNPSFVGDSNLTLAETGNPGSTESVPVAGDGISLANKPGGGPLANPGKLPLLLLARKQPLSKSLSMPDVNTKMKNRQRLLALREYARSESEKSFDECEMRRARLKALGLAYLSPQNKSLAQSFRYMRNKPTIIAFKTPSLEHCEVQRQTAAVDRKSPADTVTSPGSQLIAAEEGRGDFNISGLPGPNVQINYPVGKPVEIYMDGPYGAPSAHIFRAQHAVLIATGIGVTPFASILQSIMHRYWKARHSCPKCQFSWASEIPPTVMHLRKVDFFWINRDQRSFEWFVNLLSQLEMEQAELGAAMERFLEMHMYITSALQRTDMKAVGLQLALDLLHQKEKRDLITGLKTRTNAGRPNWDKVFAQIQAQRKGKVTVFFCGPPQLARIIRVKCGQFGFHFRKEVF